MPGASEELATKAATEVATYHEARLARVETRLSVLTWMVLGSVFSVWSKLSEIGGRVARLTH